MNSQSNDPNFNLELKRNLHVKYLIDGLYKLPSRYEFLDCAQPWLGYWIIHSLALLGEDKAVEQSCDKVIKFLQTHCLYDGGYGGGFMQIPHLATTYAGINALVSLRSLDALKSIDRPKLYQYLMRMKQEDGSFILHEDGEKDVRGVYCAAAVAYITGINTPELFENSAQWLIKCQTYEGGFGATPGNEAHGGYSFCALAALTLFGQAGQCDLKALLRWALMKQDTTKGGFAGRTNKLVDGCYSFWQGALIAIIDSLFTKETPDTMNGEKWMFDQKALQDYLLLCCQDPKGGLIDKPGMKSDFYHTCYDLSGLTIAQASFTKDTIVGPENNTLIRIHPVYNLTVEAVRLANQFFNENPVNLK
ncbi:farnesyl transferase beta subunit [Brevipalpus obovatus]|uniref:farnesyl transferase beta subunit n=1 Tax=Brevipalpus obovatus TaxID=246614 RepID=UPI003D9FA861